MFTIYLLIILLRAYLLSEKSGIYSKSRRKNKQFNTRKTRETKKRSGSKKVCMKA